MGFSPPGGGGGSGSIAGASDVTLNSPQDDQVLAYDDGSAKWQNAFSGSGGSGGSAAIVVASSDAPTAVKSTADYVCDGTADQVQINQAIEQAFDDNRPQVILAGGRFYISNRVVMYPHVEVRGLGLGTSVTSVGMPAVGMFELFDHHTNLTHLRDMTLYGNYSAGGQSHALYYLNEDSGGNDGNMGTYFPGSNPDSAHRIHNLYVQGFTGGTRHGLWISKNCRDAEATGVRISQVSGTAFYIDGSDNKYVSCTASAANVGFHVSGGNTVITNCKSAYSVEEGFLVTSSRAQLVGAIAQDSGTHGFNVSGVDPTLVGCVADSNSRLTTSAYGLKVSSSRAFIDGINLYDRGQSTNRQNRGIDFTGSSDVFLTGSCRLASGSAYVNGTPTGYVRLNQIGSSVLKIG